MLGCGGRFNAPSEATGSTAVSPLVRRDVFCVGGGLGSVPSRGFLTRGKFVAQTQGVWFLGRHLKPVDRITINTMIQGLPWISYRRNFPAIRASSLQHRTRHI
jgi:hypothetical protein